MVLTMKIGLARERRPKLDLTCAVEFPILYKSSYHLNFTSPRNKMALTKCKECGNEISTKATICPKCGAKIVRTKLSTWLIGAFFMAAIIGAAMNPSKSPVAEPAPAKTPDHIAASKKRDAQLQLGAMGAIALKKSMKDPEAFTLTSATVKDSGTTCYEYRAKNGFGAIFPGDAVLTSKGKLLVHEHNGHAFISAWNKECTKGGGDEIAAFINTRGIL